MPILSAIRPKLDGEKRRNLTVAHRDGRMQKWTRSSRHGEFRNEA